jgi:hypothetical protein
MPPLSIVSSDIKENNNKWSQASASCLEENNKKKTSFTTSQHSFTLEVETIFAYYQLSLKFNTTEFQQKFHHHVQTTNPPPRLPFPNFRSHNPSHRPHKKPHHSQHKRHRFTNSIKPTPNS